MKSSQLRLFADDSIIYKTIKSQKDCDSLQKDLDAAANKLGVLIDGDFKFGVLLLVFVRFLGGDTGNLYRNIFCRESMSVPLSSFP
jgi:hypothetical protein